MPKPIVKSSVYGTPVSIYRRHVTAMGRSDGLCEKRKKGFAISIRPGLQPERELEVLLHELLHAADWSKDEEWVEHVGHEATQIIRAWFGERLTILPDRRQR